MKPWPPMARALAWILLVVALDLVCLAAILVLLYGVYKVVIGP